MTTQYLEFIEAGIRHAYRRRLDSESGTFMLLGFYHHFLPSPRSLSQPARLALAHPHAGASIPTTSEAFAVLTKAALAKTLPSPTDSTCHSPSPRVALLLDPDAVRLAPMMLSVSSPPVLVRPPPTPPPMRRSLSSPKPGQAGFVQE
ncbi:hypothetical protein K438DRAFT_2027307 [Mycena galopus ATCC 62051]|nr:hypothetical protein K438DRAFT_2027307 [Mycena galopus ATCC 62051]